METQRVSFGCLDKLKNDIFLYGAYIPPRKTTENVNIKTDNIEKLEKSFLKYKGKGDSFMTRNLNARTGNIGNIHDSKLYEHLEGILPNSVETSDLTMRCSNDLKTNRSRNILIKLCSNHNLRITNGQITGDRIGNFTCFNNSGTSAVDYFLAESPISSLRYSTQNIHPLLLLSRQVE